MERTKLDEEAAGTASVEDDDEGTEEEVEGGFWGGAEDDEAAIEGVGDFAAIEETGTEEEGRAQRDTSNGGLASSGPMKILDFRMRSFMSI